MTRPYNERRNKKILVMIERRKIPPKEVAARLGIAWSTLRSILHRLKCNKMQQKATPLPQK